MTDPITHRAPRWRLAVALIAGLGLVAAPSGMAETGSGGAQSGDEDDTAGMGDGLSLIEEGARLFLRGLMDEMAPMLRDLEGMIDDLALYHPPEILPNGDIILRRRVPLEPDAVPPGAPDAQPGEEIDI